MSRRHIDSFCGLLTGRCADTSQYLGSPPFTSHYKSVGTNAGVAVRDLDRDTAKELGVKEKYKVACVPDVVLPDINMPKKNGSEVLERMKKEPRLQSLPVII